MAAEPSPRGLRAIARQVWLRLRIWVLTRWRSLPRSRRELRRWLETTENLVHLSALLLVPVSIAVVTSLSNAAVELSFLLFPPLASGTYTLFADPRGEYASPTRFVGGLTLGASCGWIADVLLGGGGAAVVNPVAAGVAIFLAIVTTWALDLEEPAAYATALLALVTQEASAFLYVASVAGATLLVAGVFVLWRRTVYQRRATLLYGTLSGDDHVLVVTDDGDDPAIDLGARLAAAHEAGQVMLVRLVEEESELKQTASDLGGACESVRERYDVPCDVAVMAGGAGEVLDRAVADAGSDLVVVHHDESNEDLVLATLASPVDTVVLDSKTDRHVWERCLAMVARPGDTAHAMLDFAGRLADDVGEVAACHCVANEASRRQGERLLANIVETDPRAIETRLAKSNPADFVADHADAYDLVLFGAPQYGGDPLRFISGAESDRLENMSADVALVATGPIR